MRAALPSLACILVSFVVCGFARAREWSDTTGQFKMEADAVAFNDKTVILKSTSGRMLAVELAELSEADQKFVQSKEAKDFTQKSIDQLQTWTAADGLKVVGRVLAYGRKELVLNRKLGKVFVNDQPFARIDPLHQKLILKIISHLENVELENEHQLESWAKSLGAEAKTYQLEGVLMQLESGDEIGVPFFLFSSEDLKVLQPGWQHWLSQDADEQAKQRESLMLQSSAMEYQRDRQQQHQIEMLKLNMIARATGLITIWEVMLAPAGNLNARRMSVMVQADNSAIATQQALQQYPGYSVVGVKASRRL